MTERASADSMRHARTLGAFLFGLLVWLAYFEAPSGVPALGLDNGWLAAMPHFLAHGAHAGTDWIFTAGPLAGTSSPMYEPDLYWWKLCAWEGAWRLCTVVCLVLAVLRVRGRLERALCGLYLIGATIYFDGWALMTLMAAAVVLDDEERPPRQLVEWIVLVAIGGMALVKFTILVAAVVLVGALVVARAARRGRTAGIVLASKSAAVLAALWFLAGQGVGDVWPYVTTAWQIASNYSEAQSTPGQPELVRTLGLITVAALGLMLVLWTRAVGGSRARVATALGLAFVIFCGWKTGFVRAADHAGFYFSCVPIAALLLPLPESSTRRGEFVVRMLRLFAFAVGCLGIWRSSSSGALEHAREFARAPQRIGRALATLADPGARRDELEKRLGEERARLLFSETRARVGHESIDFLGFHQGLLLLHGMDWTPRPAFQGYIAFTPDLQRRNADFLSGPRAPRYLLSSFESIDGRWPTMDDALALEIVSRGYEPVLLERGYLLLERRDGGLRETQHSVVLERDLRFGETLALPPAEPDAAQLLTLDLRTTPTGWLARLLESTPAIRMRLTLDDGTTRAGRIVPSMMRSRVLIDPVVETQDEWTDWMLGRDLLRCVALTIEPPEGGTWRFEPAFRVRVESARGLQPGPHAGLEPPAWLLGVAATAPERIYTARAPSRATVEGRPAAVVHAPSRLAWRIEPGTYRIRLVFGVLPDALEATASGEFLVLDTAPGDAHVHLRRQFGPGTDLARGGREAFETTFVKAAPGDLVLATTSGTDWAGRAAVGSDAGCYWAEVRLERLRDGDR